MHTLDERLRELVQACFTGIWIESQEHPDALESIARLCRTENWRGAAWNIDEGIRPLGANLDPAFSAEATDPLAVVRSLKGLAGDGGTTLLVLENYHRFLSSAEIVQAVARAVRDGKFQRTILVVLAPLVQIPLELEKLFVVVEHELPGRAQLEQIARELATEEGELPSGAALETLLDAAAGLTRYEAENAFSLSLVRESRLVPDTVWELKSGMLKKSGLLQLHRSGDSFERLGGLESLKTFCRRSLLRSVRTNGPRARGVLLLGVPGVGKSAFAKALGRETQRPTLALDIGALMGSLVGQTEANIRRALAIADLMAPCILFCDEVEKALSGAGSSSDSGVSQRLFGTLLTWMNDHTTDVFLVCTCNDVSKLPPEFTRAERFDGVFFLDLPNAEQREAIWQIYLAEFAVDAAQRRPVDARWTGAEIRACCRLAALLDLPLRDAAQHVVPIAATAGEAVERLRSWADGRCLSADSGGIFRKGKSTEGRRRVSREPSSN